MENVTQIQFIDTFGVTGPQGIIDVETSSQFAINLSVGDVRDPFKKSGGKSYKFDVVGSKETNKLLNNYFDINIVDGTYNKDRKQKIAIIRNGIVVFDNWYMQLLQIKKKSLSGVFSDQEITYEVEVGDDVTSFFTDITNRYLEDLDFHDMVHTYEAAEVIASFGNSAIRDKVAGTGGYKYVLPWTPLTKYRLEECRPAISVYEYWNRIHQAAGYQWTWDGFDGDDIRMDKLWIPFNGDTPKASDLYLSQVAAENSAPLLFDNSIAFDPTIDTQDFIIDTEVQDLSGLYNPVTGLYTSNIYTGASALDVTFEVEYAFEYDNPTAGTAYLTMPAGLPTTVQNWNVQGFCDLKSLSTGMNSNNAVWMNETLETVSGTPYTLAPGLNTISSGTVRTATIPVTWIALGEQLETRIGVPVTSSLLGLYFRTAASGGSVVDVKPYLTITSIKMIIIPRADNYGYNSQVLLNDFVPAKIKQSEFIKGIANMYNLVITPDPTNEKNIVYTKRDTYYDNGAQKDWTKKLHSGKDAVVSFISSTNAKKVVLSYKPDSDIVNKDYLAETKEVYGQLEYSLQNQNIKGVEYKEILFSPTPVDDTSFGTVNPMWVGQTPKCNIRILLDGGEQPTGLGGSMTYDIINYTNGGVDYGVTGIDTYPMLTHQDNPVTPVFDINFGICDKYYHNFTTLTNNNLYTLHWRRTIGQIDSGKLFTAYFILTEYDISILKLNDKIFVKDTWYNINTLQYDPNSFGPTKVVLMTVDEELAIGFPKTIGIVGRPILGTTTLGNLSEEIYSTLNWNYADSSVRVMGTNNRVGAGVKNVLIVGDNNLVNESNSIYTERLVTERMVINGVEISLVNPITIGYRIGVAGENSVIIGGTETYGLTASGVLSMATGDNASAPHYGEEARATFFFANQADAQKGSVAYGYKTLNNTPAELFLDGVAGTARFGIQLNTMYAIEIRGIAVDTATGDSAMWTGKGIIKNVAGVVSLVAAIVPTQDQADASMVPTVLAVAAVGNYLELKGTGLAATNILWNVSVDYTKIGL